ncbi:MAG: sugar phosphate nucleotidyltransferase [Ruminococcus sp.]|nr:sugar phosphate nucleotidyltransferase [Ruminococcus sp.]
MQAIVLCGGRGERLMPLTAKLPAPLLRMVGKEILLYTIEQLLKTGVERITLAVGYGGKEIKQFAETLQYENVRIDLSSCSDDGTAPAVAYAADRNRKEILVIEGNSLFNCNLTELVEFHRNKSALCTALLTDVYSEDVTMARTDKNCEVEKLVANPAPSQTSFSGGLTGIYCIDPEIFNEVNFSEGDFSHDILPMLAEKGGRLYAMKKDMYYRRILTPKGFLSAQQNIMYSDGIKITNNTNRSFSGVTFIPPVYIGTNVTIETGTVVGKGTVLDNGCSIGKRSKVIGAYMGENSSVGRNCEIDSAVICRKAQLGNQVKCGFHSVAGDGAVMEDESELSSNSALWSDTKAKSGSVVRDKLLHGSQDISYIDDDGIFTVIPISQSVQECMNFGIACASALENGQNVLIGRSGKIGADILSQALSSGIAAGGAAALDLSECSCPQLAYLVGKTGCKIGLYLDINSHCTIRVVSVGGLPIKRELEYRIENAVADRNFRPVSPERYGRIASVGGTVYLYENYLSSLLPLQLKGISPQIRANDKITAELADRVFRPRSSLSGERITFHISSDGMRCTAYSDGAGNVTWERLAALGMAAQFEEGKPVAVPYCFSSVADRVAENFSGRLYRYYNSSADNSDDEARQIAETEHCNFMRDGLALSAVICGYLSRKGISLVNVLERIPAIYCSQRYVAAGFDGAELLEALCASNAVCGEGAVYDNQNSRAIIRPLKNRRGVIIFSESMQCEHAAALCEEICDKIKMLENRKKL